MKVLIIDDDAAIRRCLTRSLRAHHDVSDACSVDTGIEAIRSIQPDVIVCDLRLGQASGLAIWAAVQRDDPASARRFIFMSGESDPIVGELRGVDHRWLQKPFARSTLLTLIDGLGPRPETLGNSRSELRRVHLAIHRGVAI